MKVDKLQGTCSVCLRPMQLHGGRPIRHGFSAVGVRHGQHGGWHTGPCGGSNFPHLGISTEGTVWALGIAQKRLDATNEALRRFEGNPDLIYYPRVYGRAKGGTLDTSRPTTLRYGDEPNYMPATSHPGYDYVHKQRVAEEEARKVEFERSIAAYEKVLATWSPQKYPTTGAAVKAETVHMEMPRKNTRYGEWKGIACRSTRPGYASDKLQKTNDPSKVTCKRCRAILGLST